MNYSGINYNDIVNGENVCVSLWTQGCMFHCPGCHNPQTWDPEGGEPVPTDLTGQIIKAISVNGITRNFSILGGEPLAEWNLSFVLDIVTKVRAAYPNITIYLWTGYTMEYLIKKCEEERETVYAINKDGIKLARIAVIGNLEKILNKIDVLIDGPYIQEKRDLTLELRGSKNQHIWRKVNNRWEVNLN